jgi:hypothetical protein
VFSNCLGSIDVASSEFANASVWAFNPILLPDIHIFLASECIDIKIVRYFLITIEKRHVKFGINIEYIQG